MLSILAGCEGEHTEQRRCWSNRHSSPCINVCRSQDSCL